MLAYDRHGVAVDVELDSSCKRNCIRSPYNHTKSSTDGPLGGRSVLGTSDPLEVEIPIVRLRLCLYP